MKTIRLSLAVLLVSGIILLTGCQSGQIEDGSPPRLLAEFAITGDANNILLPVEFDGQQYEFLLDTGTTNTVFDNSFKDKLGRRILWAKKGDAAYGKKVTVEMFHAPEAFVGPFNLERMGYVVTADLDKIVPDEDRQFQGIIGMDFMSNYIVRMDFDERKVSFLTSSKETGMFSFLKPRENEHPEWGRRVPLKEKWFSDLRYVKGRLLDKIDAEFLIDSGWHFPGVLNSRLFAKISSLVVPAEQGIRSATIRTNNRGKVIITETFSIDSLEYNDMFFQKSNISILGLPFLSRHLVTFDFPNNVMYLQKGNAFDRPSIPPIYIQGLEFAIQYRRNNAVVSFVDPNGPAYLKGIRENDILTEINDVNITSFGVMEFTQFWTNLFSGPVDVLSLTLKRGDDIMTISFTKKQRDTKTG